MRQVVHAYRTDQEELEAELLKRLWELKIKHQVRAKDWKSFLARSLYNAANNFVRDRRVHETKIEHLDVDQTEDRAPSLVEILAAREDPIDLRLDLATLWQQMSPELRELWGLLLEEEGNTSAVATRLGRPRKTVEYWIQKLRRFFQNRGW